jgi:predicted ester cyclase
MHEISGVVREFVEEVLNQGRIDAADRLVWDDMVEHVPFPGQGPGLQGLKDVLRGMRAAFPDMHWHIEEQLTEGDRVLTRFEWTGTPPGRVPRRACYGAVGKGVGHGHRPHSGRQD